jgi:hypothetical protein
MKVQALISSTNINMSDSTGTNIMTKVKLNPHDVLLGRGDWTVRYEGNVRFRDLIREKRDLFGAASGRSARDLVASDIIRIISDRGGRFLRKEADVPVGASEEVKQERDDCSPIDGTWVVVDKKTAMKKVKQAFRDKDSWTQKVDPVALPSSATTFSSLRLPQPEGSASLPSLLTSSTSTLPGPFHQPISNNNLALQTQLIQNQAVMAETLQRYDFEQSLLAAVQQQQQQRNLDASRLTDLNRLRQLSSSFGLNPSQHFFPQQTSALQNQSALGINPSQFLFPQQQLSALQQKLSADLNTTEGMHNNPTLLQQQLLALQQQQQVELALRESMLLRNRQQDAVLNSTGLNPNWLGGGGDNLGLAFQQLRAAQQMNLLQQQQQSLMTGGGGTGGTGGALPSVASLGATSLSFPEQYNTRTSMRDSLAPTLQQQQQQSLSIHSMDERRQIQQEMEHEEGKDNESSEEHSDAMIAGDTTKRDGRMKQTDDEEVFAQGEDDDDHDDCDDDDDDDDERYKNTKKKRKVIKRRKSVK